MIDAFARTSLLLLLLGNPCLAQPDIPVGSILDGFEAQGPQTTITLNGRNQLIDMEDLRNPLVIFQTTRGDFVAELFPSEAPQTVANFMALAAGSKAFVDTRSGNEVMRPFYDGLVFHRVINNFLIQGGSPDGTATGSPGFSIPDEINAVSLGLDLMPVLDPQGYPNPILGIRNQEDFQQRVLLPLYRALGIDNQAAIEARIAQVDERLRAMSVKDLYELQGYRYMQSSLSRAPLRGMLVMAGGGSEGNGSQFFVTLSDAPWLTGRHTVFGRIRAGMEVVDTIGRIPVGADNRPLDPVSILLVRPLQLQNQGSSN
jgi:cyclophilin family peptidyl-prolyl cis-trans isomerase